jgi:hypothetical protein
VSDLPAGPEGTFACALLRCRLLGRACLQRQAAREPRGNHPPRPKFDPCGFGTCKQGARVAAHLSGAPAPAQAPPALKPAPPAEPTPAQRPEFPLDDWGKQALANIIHDRLFGKRADGPWSDLAFDPWDDTPIGHASDPVWAPFWAEIVPRIFPQPGAPMESLTPNEGLQVKLEPDTSPRKPGRPKKPGPGRGRGVRAARAPAAAPARELIRPEDLTHAERLAVVEYVKRQLVELEELRASLNSARAAGGR